ncbi:hypothetical protein [Variovorax sp. RO1]|uniref:hypothetical protein n=1 Tax=Variovorax sp. RO1 TaxID=2066034 RepID=UPI00117BE57E|nr:hypothetical protein [Variovorax sp. RO1]
MDSANDLDALTRIISALRPLKRDEQLRALRAVILFLGLDVELTDASAPRPAPTRTYSEPLSPPTPGSFSEDRALSPKDFLRDKAPISDVERIACLGYYLTHYRDTPHFKTLDVSALNTEAAQPKLSNASMAVENASKAGLLVQAIKGAKQVSAIGEHYVQLLPDRDAARDYLRSANLRKRPKRTAKKTAQASTTSSLTPPSEPQ